jgi:pimeloyl-ACP methyl ester carboxylesterase
MANRSRSTSTKLRTRQIRLGDLRFDVAVGGDPEGDAVMLLHGFPQTSEAWSSTTPALIEQGYRVIAPDQRGYSPGARPRARAAYGLDALTADVIRLTDALGVPRVHLERS